MLRILRRPEVIRVTGYSGTRIDELERAGRFPRRRRLSGGRAVGWLSTEIEDFIANLPLASERLPDLAGNPRARGVGKAGASTSQRAATAERTEASDVTSVARRGNGLSCVAAPCREPRPGTRDNG